MPSNHMLSRFAAAALFVCASAGAQTVTAPAGMREAAQKAIAGNPEVSARLNALRASVAAVDVASGALRPRVDLQAVAGSTRDRNDARTPVDATLDRSGVAVSVSQLLWDGRAVQEEVARLGHDKLARWFEFVDASEQAALEAARAYDDVRRFRRLVQLAEDSYVQHRYAFGQIDSRVRAGVGRGVDLEQAAARLALAEANLSAEAANLHDVSSRYLRIVGELPPAAMAGTASFASALPASAGEAMAQAVRDNAAISASIENLRAARAAVRGRDSAFQPRVEARLRSGAGHNLDGTADQRRDTTAELVLSWNLYNGGSDQARIRQAASLLDQAADLRDKACRDTRQTASIAYNDTRKLVEQIQALERNALSIEKARDAYRQQFDIGQRSLLDLLNAENEVYTARRALVNAEYDLTLAQLRTLAATQRLSAELGLARSEAPAGVDPSGWAAGNDLPGRCPTLVAEVMTTPRSELDARAQRMLANAPTAPSAPSAPSGPVPQTRRP